MSKETDITQNQSNTKNAPTESVIEKASVKTDEKKWEQINKYKKLLAKNPMSQVFAPLADAYLDKKMLVEAESIARTGIKRHPNFAGGWIMLGKVLKEKARYAEAIAALEQAKKLDPNNLLAYLVMGDIYLLEKDAKKALQSFKIALFLDPKITRAQNVVQKLESLTADEYGQELFEMGQLKPVAPVLEKNKKSPVLASTSNKESKPKGLDRMLSLIDAFIVRHDLTKAQELIDESITEFGENAELRQRQSLLFQKSSSQLADESEVATPLQPIMSRELAIRDRKLKILNGIISALRHFS